MTATARGFSTQELQEERARTLGGPSSDFARLLDQPITFTEKQRNVILQTCCGGATQKEADQLIAIAEARGLDPIKGECYFVKRWDSQKRQEVWAVQASIDSFRIKADETGLYDGQDEPEYEYGPDGKVPSLARVRIWRKGISRPFVGVARFDEYVQRTKEGAPTRFWKNMPHNQLAKCAEALGFRKAFPARFAKVYTPEEMAQADSVAAPAHDPETGEVQEPSPLSQAMLKDHSEALFKADTLDALRIAGQAIAKDVKAHRLTSEQAETLKKIATAKKTQIVARQKGESPAPTTDADSPPPDDVELSGDDPDQGP